MSDAVDLNARYMEAAHLIQGADTILVTAGAGLGVDSGLPDFRGDEGFYKAYPAFKPSGLSFINVANPEYLQSHPSQFWWFYGHRFQIYAQAMPHKGYQILKKWIDRKDGFVFTSNVDGHFQKAGISAAKIVECHGAINQLQCANGCSGYLEKIDRLPFKSRDEALKTTGPLPRCPVCGELARPNILMFGDAYWDSSRADRQMERLTQWEERLEGKRLVVIEIGAGRTIPTVRWQSESMRAPIIRINPNVDDCNVDTGVSITNGALEALTRIDEALNHL